MATDIEEMVKNNVEEITVKDVIEQTKEHKKDHWKVRVALSSSLLAVLSVLAGLLATFASDEAAIALSNEADYQAYAEGVDTSQTILKMKLEMLASMGKPATDSDNEEMKRFEANGKLFRERSQAYEDEGFKAFKTHDLLAIALMLFQMTMLLNGVAVMIDRVAVWRFGLVFSVIGLVFLIRGIIGYMN